MKAAGCEERPDEVRPSNRDESDEARAPKVQLAFSRSFEFDATAARRALTRTRLGIAFLSIDLHLPTLSID